MKTPPQNNEQGVSRLSNGILTQQDVEKKRKKKSELRKKTKEERKNRIKEGKMQSQLEEQKKGKTPLDRETYIKNKNERIEKEMNQEVLDDEEIIKNLNFAQKLNLTKELADEVINNSEKQFKKINDLFVLAEDPKDVDIVYKALQQLCRVFLEIIPSYRLREDMSLSQVDDQKGAEKGFKLSKEVKQLRDYEIFLLESYKRFLQALEKLSKIKPGQIVAKLAIENEDQKQQILGVYIKLRTLSINSFCELLEKHPHFNFRLNILQTIMPKLATQESQLRKRVTQTLFFLLAHYNQELLDFKVDVLRELNKVLKQKPHTHMEPNLLDCLVLHMIIVDENKAKAIQESTQKSQQLHDQMNKLRRKGKLNEYKQIKQELLSEVKQADAIGVDLTKSSTHNNEIIKEILAIYFSVLKNQMNMDAENVNVQNQKGSPLLKSVFLGIPQFTQFINIEIVWDLINVLREYLNFELEQNPLHVNKFYIQNVVSALLCSFQIIEIGAGSSFNLEEKDFIDALYTVTQHFLLYPNAYSITDFLAYLKCCHLVFIQKKQYSNDIVCAFAKRFAILQTHLGKAEQAGILLLIKQMIDKYPSVKSSFIETDEDGATGNGFGNNSLMYKADVNDPSLANATQTHSIFEIVYTLNSLSSFQNYQPESQKGQANSNNSKQSSSVNYKLVKSIIQQESLPNEYLGLTPLQLVKSIISEDIQ